MHQIITGQDTEENSEQQNSQEFSEIKESMEKFITHVEEMLKENADNCSEDFHERIGNEIDILKEALETENGEFIKSAYEEVEKSLNAMNEEPQKAGDDQSTGDDGEQKPNDEDLGDGPIMEGSKEYVFNSDERTTYNSTLLLDVDGEKVEVKLESKDGVIRTKNIYLAEHLRKIPYMHEVG